MSLDDNATFRATLKVRRRTTRRAPLNLVTNRSVGSLGDLQEFKIDFYSVHDDAALCARITTLGEELAICREHPDRRSNVRRLQSITEELQLVAVEHGELETPEELFQRCFGRRGPVESSGK